MPSNSIVILGDILRDSHQEIAPELKDADFFEIFVVEQRLKTYELSYEEIQDGIVDGEHDGGIDAIYTFVNRELVGEEIDISPPKQRPKIELYLIQAKSANGFSESDINKIISTARHLLDLDADYESFGQYNQLLKSKLDIFRKIYRSNARKFPELSIYIIYAAKLADGDIHKNLQSKSDELINVVKEKFQESEAKFEFINADSLLSLARTKPSQSFELIVDEYLTGNGGFISLVKLTDFFKFLYWESTEIRSDLFDANVRDYQGTTEVNEGIAGTLKERTDEFWWFNNGVTVICTKATAASRKIIAIENPQVVNGLQTSSEIARYIKENQGTDDRTVMVKIVFADSEDVRDTIIKATNFQNQVPLASLRATDRVQRDIEHILKQNDLFYDRRKNHYKNQGKSKSKIISISLLAQAAMTLFLGQPDNARARPSTLIKTDESYQQLFDEKFDIQAYVVAAESIKRVDEELLKFEGLSPRDRTNIRFYVLFWVVSVSLKSLSMAPAKVATLKGKIETETIRDGIEKIWTVFKADGASDQLAKGPVFKTTVLELAREQIQATLASSTPGDTYTPGET